MSMTLISTITVSSGMPTSIDFLNIPQTFTDLYVTLSNRDTFTDFAETFLRFNGVTTNTYSHRFLRGTGTSVSSTSASSVSAINTGVQPGSTQTSNTFSNFGFYIPNYTSSSFKLVSVDSVAENNGFVGYQQLTAGLWSDTSAILQVSLIAGYVTNSTASLYGITKGSGGATVS